jgi:hypothetical protein
MIIKNEDITIIPTKDYNSNGKKNNVDSCSNDLSSNRETDLGNSYSNFDDVELSDSSTFEESCNSKESGNDNSTPKVLSNKSSSYSSTNTWTLTETGQSTIDTSIETTTKSSTTTTTMDPLKITNSFSILYSTAQETTNSFGSSDESYDSSNNSKSSANSSKPINTFGGSDASYDSSNNSKSSYNSSETTNSFYNQTTNETAASNDVTDDEISVLDENTGMLMTTKLSNTRMEHSGSLIDEFLSETTGAQIVKVENINTHSSLPSSMSSLSFLDEFLAAPKSLLAIDLPDVKNVKRFTDETSLFDDVRNVKRFGDEMSLFDDLPSFKRQKLSPVVELLSLPHKALVRIFNYLPTVEVLNNLVRVCKLFSQIAKDPEIKISVKVGRGKTIY